MFEKLQSIEDKYEQLAAEMADPAVQADNAKFRDHSKAVAEMQPLVERFRDIVHFKRGPDVLQIGRFSSPPVLHDLDALTITKDDLDLRDCRVGDCDVRLPAEAIGRFQREINWTAADADAQAAVLFKRILYEDVRTYVSGGRRRLTACPPREERRHPRPPPKRRGST